MPIMFVNPGRRSGRSLRRNALEDEIARERIAKRYRETASGTARPAPAKNPRKKRRSAKQIAATKKLVAMMKKKRRSPTTRKDTSMKTRRRRRRRNPSLRSNPRRRKRRARRNPVARANPRRRKRRARRNPTALRANPRRRRRARRNPPTGVASAAYRAGYERTFGKKKRRKSSKRSAAARKAARTRAANKARRSAAARKSARKRKSPARRRARKSRGTMLTRRRRRSPRRRSGVKAARRARRTLKRSAAGLNGARARSYTRKKRFFMTNPRRRSRRRYRRNGGGRIGAMGGQLFAVIKGALPCAAALYVSRIVANKLGAAIAGSSFGSRIPGYAQYSAPMLAGITLVGAHVLTSKVSALRPYRGGILIGTGINFIDTLVSAFAPASVAEAFGLTSGVLAVDAAVATEGYYDDALSDYEGSVGLGDDDMLLGAGSLSSGGALNTGIFSKHGW